ncbi:outer membrane protein assembly factor BamB family protein [Archangium lipolyticum]|uniref:outer membrane protein assembly factor BamB family protein n=1 Tax=Archangium lipolyticum TaxID=2970465 RepID=UPI00214A477D|nr:PQQ-binding-like beta-propeller repeat protein [Archangium lipolyticum]
MTWEQRKFPALVLLGWLTACGGGGGGTPGDGGDPATPPGEPSTPPPAELAFVPGQLTETYAAGASVALSVKATLNVPLPGDIHAIIVDSSGVLVPEISIQPDRAWAGSYFARFRTNPSLPQGRHQGRLEVHLCQDKACTTEHAGSPWYLPYDFQILPNTNLTPLTRWAQAPDWETFQGNAAHSGYVPVTLDASRFSPRWRWTVPEDAGGVSEPVVANGLVYLASAGRYSSGTPPRLFALRESDSGKQWQVDLSVSDVNPPAVSGGKVYVSTGTGYNNAFMWSFDATTGAQLSKAAFNSQGQRYFVPTIEGGVVYANGGYYGGMYAFGFADGAQRWFRELPMYNEWTPAVDAKYVYAYTGGLFSALDKSTGAVAFTLGQANPGGGGDTPVAPVIGSNGSVVVASGGKIVSFNPASRAKTWTLDGPYSGNPVTANGVLYVTQLAPYRLEARSEVTGALLWSWAPAGFDEVAGYDTGGRSSGLLVTDNLVFVSTNRRVYAIDLATHAPVWSYWEPGSLALSANGVLYVRSMNGLGAVNLK